MRLMAQRSARAYVPLDEAVLHVDDEECRVRPVLESICRSGGVDEAANEQALEPICTDSHPSAWPFGGRP